MSYQANTLTVRLSTTWVSGASKMQECGLPTMSQETSASVEYSRTPFIVPWAACSTALLTCSTVTSVPRVATRSTIDPSGTGTRTAMPSSLPSSCGSTWPTARAAPVVVGIVFSPAARERRMSLWAQSARRWSFV